MKQNITLVVLALIALLLFAAGMTQKSGGALWTIVSLVGFIVFILSIYKIVIINLPKK